MKRLILFVFIIITLYSVSAMAQNQATVIINQAQVREKPLKSSKLIFTAKKNTKLKLESIEHKNGWYYVSILNSNQKGWIFGNDIKIDEKRLVEVTLTTNESVKGEFISASPMSIQIAVRRNIVTLNWNDIKQIIFVSENKNPVIGNLPTSISSNNTTTQNQKVENQPVKEIGEINKKPFEDLGDLINDKLSKNEIDLNKNFLVVLDGTLTADGKLDKDNSRYVRSEGDEQMVIVAKDAIEAIGDSGFLAYLRNYGIDKANLTLRQDDTQIYILLVSDQKDANKANTTASGFNTMLQGLILLDKNGIKKLDDSSRLLVNNAKVTSDGKNFVLSVAIPKADAQTMINKSLKDRAETKAKKTSKP